MNKFKFLIISISLLGSTYTMYAFDKLPKDISWPQVTEESKDAAYSAPASKLYGTWISDENYEITFNSNGSATVTRPTEFGVAGFDCVEVWTYRWSKKKNSLELVGNVENVKIVIEDKDKYNSLSARKKEEIKEELQQNAKKRSFSRLLERGSKSLFLPYYINYLSNDYMQINFDRLVKKSNLNKIKAEAEAKAKAEAEEKAKAAEEAAKAKAEAEEKAKEAAKAKAAAEEKAKEEYDKMSAELRARTDIYREVDERAEFPGGYDELLSWLNENCSTPQAATEKNMKGLLVMVECVVEKDGTVSFPRIIGLQELVEKNEVLSLIKKMPKWQPAKKNGTTVASIISFPLRF